jgi:hypothetical protein
MATWTKNLLFFLFFFIPIGMFAQQTAVPTKVRATYREYPNRIVINWNPTDSNYPYKLYRREVAQKMPEWIATIHQNWYVDRDSKLKNNRDYVYQVRAVSLSGLESDWSEEAIGALLPVANSRDTLAPSLKKCLEITILKANASAQGFALTFLVTSKCKTLNSVQLTLFRSDDALLDEKDNLLQQLPFKTSSSRGALWATNHGEPITGYLLLKIESEEDSFVMATPIK